MADRVQVVKWEKIGPRSQDNQVPNEINYNEDGLDMRSTFLQDDTSGDKDVEITRENGVLKRMLFKDGENPVYVSLTQLLEQGITEAEHAALRQLIHLADGKGGPFEEFASGAYREIEGQPFPTSVVWYTDDTKAKKIVEKTITRNANQTPSSIEWKVYDTDGSTVLATATDDIEHSGVFETSRTRTIA